MQSATVDWVQGGGLLVSLTLLAAVLEGTAPPTGGFAFFSAGAYAYFALAIDPRLGPRTALTAALGALGLRTVFRGQPGVAARLRELLSDLLPISLALAVLSLRLSPGPRQGIALAVYMAAVLWPRERQARLLSQSERLVWHPLHTATGWLRVGPPLAALAIGPWQSWIGPWALLPVLIGLQQTVENLGHRLAARKIRQVQAQLEHSSQALDIVKGTVAETRQQLLSTMDERNLLQEFTQLLASSPDLTRTLDLILSTTCRVVNYRSVAIFVPAEGQLVPVRYVTPHPERLDSARLTRTQEPVVEECWQRRQQVELTDAMRRKMRLFEREKSAVALPLQHEGVLYIGREEETPYTEQELHMVSLVAGLAALALQSSSRQLAREQALALHAQAHAQLQAWVDRLSILLEGSRDFASTLDPDHLMEHLERVALRTVSHGYGCIAYGQPLQLRQWRVDGTGAAEPDLAALRGYVTQVMEHRRPLLVETEAGGRFPPVVAGLASVVAVPMLTEEGPVGAVVLSAAAFDREHQDLLQLLAFQGAASLSNARLFRDVVEARKQLEQSQAQLVQSSKMAAVGQLAAGVAHEINSPLGAIVLALDSAENKLAKNPEQALPKLQRARKAAGRARQIIEKLLFYSRQTSVDRMAVSPIKLLDDALEFLAHQLQIDGVEVHREVVPVPNVEANPHELQQVLINLIMNARDAMQNQPPERRKLKVMTKLEGDQVVLGVQDLGEGIAPESLQKIFDPFFTTKDVGKGTGLGLSVSMEIVKQHGGRIEVSSQPGAGSTFRIFLPRKG